MLEMGEDFLSIYSKGQLIILIDMFELYENI